MKRVLLIFFIRYKWNNNNWSKTEGLDCALSLSLTLCILINIILNKKNYGRIQNKRHMMRKAILYYCVTIYTLMMKQRIRIMFKELWKGIKKNIFFWWATLFRKFSIYDNIFSDTKATKTLFPPRWKIPHFKQQHKILKFSSYKVGLFYAVNISFCSVFFFRK